MGLIAAAQLAIRKVSLVRDLSKLTAASSGDNLAYWTELPMRSEHGELTEEAQTAESFNAEYELKGRLGAGGFGSVHAAVRRSDGERVAVKRLAARQQPWRVQLKFQKTGY